MINGVMTKLHLAVFTSSASKFRYAYLYTDQSKNSFMDTHVKFIRNKAYAKKYKFNSFNEAKAYLQNILYEINKNCDIELEKNLLQPYKPKLFIDILLKHKEKSIFQITNILIQTAKSPSNMYVEDGIIYMNYKQLINEAQATEMSYDNFLSLMLR